MSKVGKRTPGLETTQSIINKTIQGLGKNFARKYYAHVILWNWNKIVGNAIGNNVEPQGLRGDTLHLYCYDPSLRQELRLLMFKMIQKINNFVGMELVKNISFGARWQKSDTEGIEEIRLAEQIPELNIGRERKKVPLSQAELNHVDELVGSVEDEEIASKVRELCRKNLQLQKLRHDQHWHACATCGAQCPPEEKYCTSCKVKAHESIIKLVRQVLLDIPWARGSEVRKYVPECTNKLLNEQRAILVQKLATEVVLTDINSLKAKQLVMLYRCLPPEQLTDDIIARALYELRFNLHRPADYKTPKRYSIIKLKGDDRRQN